VELLIQTPSRLHLSLLDLNGSLGRIDGGVGLTLKKPSLVLELKEKGTGVQVEFIKPKNLSKSNIEDYVDRIGSSAIKMMKYLGIDKGLTFIVHENFPSHSGLGSGTQLSLAVGKLISDSVKHEIEVPKIASIVGRGGTSGIGVASFENGGFIIDGGHHCDDKREFLPSSASKALPTPILARYDFPEEWKVILVIPDVKKNVSGTEEVNIFQEYCPIPLEEVQQMSHLLLMKMMPAVLEKDLDAFGDSVNRIQDIGFKKIENQLQKPVIGEIMNLLRDAGAPGVGMSSFGPTIYAITDSVKDIVSAAHDALEGVGGYVMESEAQNYGCIYR
jgi:beta-ribofuranosylaminobenzene 5'-phosphate synthase